MAQKKNKTGAKSTTRKQQAERIRRAKEAAEARARTKKIFTIVVCVILVLALCIPTMALTVLSM